jgi:uncharacterized membrane protein YbhN (UPF0104 family)
MAENNHSEQKLKRPSLIRQLIPWVFAAGILAFMFHKIDFEEVAKILKNAKASWIISAYLFYCVTYYFCDILSFYRSYNWFNTKISLGETARLRLASFAVQAINGAITELMSVLYMLRVKKVPALESTSSAGFIYFNEILTMVALLSYCAFFLAPEYRIQVSVPYMNLGFWTLFQALIIAAWAFVPVWLLFWRTGIRDRFPKVRDNVLLTAFKKATVANYGEVFFYRFANNFLSLIANIVILKALGIDAPLPLLFAAVPIMVNVAYWPVSAGGFGGPQLVAHYLLKGYASEEAVFAYSILWSALFFLTRSLTGIAFIRPVYKAAFPAEK